jgi:hypothetical protein
MMSLNSRNAPALDLPARFMGLAIASLAIAVLSAPWTLPLMQGQFNGFRLLALVHLMTLGFVGSMIIGASYQLVPVALQVPLFSVTLGRMSFPFYLGGLVLFLTGLLREWLPGLAIGGSLLGIAFALYIVIIVGTFIRAPHKDAIAWHIVLGSVLSGLGMVLGVMLAFNKGNGFLAGRLLDVLAAHIIVMLVGWVTITYTGVAYRLVGMFTLAEKHVSERQAWMALGLFGGGTTLLALRFMPGLPAMAGWAGAAMILGGGVLFSAQLRRMYRKRMRRTFDIHMPFAIASAAMLLIAALSLLVGLILGSTPADPLWMATGWLVIFGMVSTAIQGFFYKISTFLVWLKRYAPVAGTQPVPRLEEMYSRTVGMTGFWLWSAAIGAGWLALMLEQPWLPFIGVLLVAGALCFVFNVMNIARHWMPSMRSLLSVAIHQGTGVRA